ncbi:MAG: UDP-N-acetylglucosamine 2-epimerase (non-hydrolyzing) [Candidatus Zixiibacteriota bacterium]|nr:MAG: UDP-N-acetylglucosamine 2-epimerase (non-hydrolyzing) [candidate division Zixibacteria bacterium]
MIKAALVIGARPQFIKAAPLIIEMGRFLETVMIHTGQHYDFMMSENFFEELDLPAPDYHLNLESRTPGKLTGEMIAGLECVYDFEKPDFVMVAGDTNSTLAGAVSAAQRGLRIFHVEAGVRSKDQKLPEQINRVVTDSISDCFFCPAPSAVENLKTEGKVKNVYDTGDIIYDSLRLIEKQIPDKPPIPVELPGSFALMTLHRAEAVDNIEHLKSILSSMKSSPLPIIFPAHPRTAKMIDYFNLGEEIPGNVLMFDPVGYADLLSLLRLSEFVVTDSGGVQREAVYLNKPVFVPRPETEWVDFEKLKRVRVIGYDFDFADLEPETADFGEELSYLLRPSAKKMIEILKSLF